MTAPTEDTSAARREVVLDGGTGDILLWIPVLLCLALMIAASLAATPTANGSGTDPDNGSRSVISPDPNRLRR
jgi:hypothetical protein